MFSRQYKLLDDWSEIHVGQSIQRISWTTILELKGNCSKQGDIHSKSQFESMKIFILGLGLLLGLTKACFYDSL
jgi:hypothetical protein